MASSVFFRAPYFLVDGLFKPNEDRNKWTAYDPFEVYNKWKGNPEQNFSPHIDFAKIKDGDIEGMLEFLTLWGSLYRTQGDIHSDEIPVDIAMTLLAIYKDVVEWKAQLDLGTITLEDANTMAMVIRKYTNYIKVTSSFVLVNGKVTYQDFYEFGNLFDCMMQMVNFDIRGGRFVTRKCAKENCGALFTTTGNRLFCSKECGDAVRAIRAADKKFPGRAERRKERKERE
jgi:hypothetical protein